VNAPRGKVFKTNLKEESSSYTETDPFEDDEEEKATAKFFDH